MTSEAPLYDNRVHCIRSYPARCRQPAPSEHKWLIHEAVRATLASSIFLPPLYITPKYTYGDAAFAGFSSPASLLNRETRQLWPDQQVGLVANFRPGLVSLAPKGGAVTDSYVKKLVGRMLAKVEEPLRDHEALRCGASGLMKKFINLAVDMEISHQDFDSL